MSLKTLTSPFLLSIANFTEQVFSIFDLIFPDLPIRTPILSSGILTNSSKLI